MTDLQLLKFSVQRLVLYGHLALLALAMVAVVREDLRLLIGKTLHKAALLDAADKLRSLLIGLWVTGVALALMDSGADLPSILGMPMVTAKCFVVAALTVNAAALRNLAFTALRKQPKNVARSAAVCAVLLGISTVTWIYAGFVGTARVIAPFMSFEGFMMLYAAALMVAIPGALALAQPPLARMMEGHEPKCIGPAHQWLMADAHTEGSDKLIGVPRVDVNSLSTQVPPGLQATGSRIFEHLPAELNQLGEHHA